MATEFQRAAADMLPHLMTAAGHLGSLGAPQAAKLSERIASILDQMAGLGEDVAMYYRKWPAHGNVPGAAELDRLSDVTGRYR